MFKKISALFSAFSRAAKKDPMPDPFQAFGGMRMPCLSREGARLALYHEDMLTVSGTTTRYVNADNFEQTVGRFASKMSTLADTNTVVREALAKCSKGAQAAFDQPADLDMFDSGYMKANDVVYNPLSRDGTDQMNASLELATQMIRVLRQGVGNDAERRAAARTLIDCGFSPVAPKWGIGYTPTDLEQIAGPAPAVTHAHDARVYQFHGPMPLSAAA